MTARCRSSLVFLWLLMPAVVAALQLPPDIQADRYLVRAQRQIEEQDFQGARESMDQILELEAEHGLQLPAEFFLPLCGGPGPAGSP